MQLANLTTRNLKTTQRIPRQLTLLLKVIVITVEKRAIRKQNVVHYRKKSQEKDQRKRDLNTGVTFATWQDIQLIIAQRIQSTKVKAKVEKEKQPKVEKGKVVKAKVEKEKQPKVEEEEEKATSHPTTFPKTPTTRTKSGVQRKQIGI